jgi:hypothetical protein
MVQRVTKSSADQSANYAFERPVTRCTSARGQRVRQSAPSARLKRLRPATQRER